MSARTKPPFRADHVGSLLRPPEVLTAREDRAAGTIDDDALREIEDAAIRDVIALPGGGRPEVDHRRRVPPDVLAHGLHLLARRHHAGRRTSTIHVQFENAAARVRLRAAGHARDVRRSRCRGRSSPTHFAFLRDNVEHGRRRSSRSRRRAWSTTAAATRRSTAYVYPDLDAFWADLTDAYAAAGAAVLRARLPLPAARRHEPRLRQRPGQREHIAAIGGDPDHLHEHVHREHQPRDRRPAGRGHGHDAPVPRQQPVDVGGRGRLRLRRRRAVRRARGRRLLHGVRRRALGRLRAAALRARRARRSCSASSRPSGRSSRPRTT